MLFMESHRFVGCRLELYGLSPYHSFALQQSVSGFNWLGASSILVVTVLGAMILIVLPSISSLVIPIVVALLAVEYLCVAVGTVGPRLMIGRIIRAKKREEMAPLRDRLNTLLPQVENLTEEEYDSMRRLQETHDTIRDSPDNLLPLGALAKVVGALLLSTLTILGTAFAEELMAEFARRFVP
jgi:hypothetical protein